MRREGLVMVVTATGRGGREIFGAPEPPHIMKTYK